MLRQKKATPLNKPLKALKSDALKQKYANIVSECKNAIFKIDQAREEKLLKANNLGAFYKFVNGKLTKYSQWYCSAN